MCKRSYHHVFYPDDEKSQTDDISEVNLLRLLTFSVEVRYGFMYYAGAEYCGHHSLRYSQSSVLKDPIW